MRLSTRSTGFHGPVESWVLGFDAVRTTKRRPQVFLNLSLWNPHVDHVRHEFNGTLDGSSVEVGLVADGPLDPELFQTTRKVVNLAFQAGCINVRQGEQLVNAGPHRCGITQGRL